MQEKPTEFRVLRRGSRRDSVLYGGQFALGFTLGLFIALIVWVLSGVLGVPLSFKTALEVFPAITAILVATVSLFLSFFALREQTRKRQAGTDPVLIAHLGHRSDEPTVVELRVTNVGAGAAMNVFVDATKPANADQKGLVTKPFDTDVLRGKKLVSVILQGECIIYILGTSPSLFQEPTLDPFFVKLRFQDIEGTEYESSHLIDINELAGRPSHSPPITKIWRELEKIAKKNSLTDFWDVSSSSLHKLHSRSIRPR